MTRVYLYLGDKNPLSIQHGSEVNIKDFQPMYRCDAEVCPVNGTLQPKDSVLAWKNNLHSCKRYPECFAEVKKAWQQQRKTFDTDTFLSERRQNYITKGLDSEQVEILARRDLDEKLRELDLPKKIKKMNFNKSTTTKLKARMRLSCMLMKRGLSRGDAVREASRIIKTMPLEKIELFLNDGIVRQEE